MSLHEETRTGLLSQRQKDKLSLQIDTIKEKLATLIGGFGAPWKHGRVIGAYMTLLVIGATAMSAFTVGKTAHQKEIFTPTPIVAIINQYKTLRCEANRTRLYTQIATIETQMANLLSRGESIRMKLFINGVLPPDFYARPEVAVIAEKYEELRMSRDSLHQTVSACLAPSLAK